MAPAALPSLWRTCVSTVREFLALALLDEIRTTISHSQINRQRRFPVRRNYSDLPVTDPARRWSIGNRAGKLEERQMGMELEEKREIGIFDINFDTGERTWSNQLKELFEISGDAPPDFQLVLQRVHPEDRRAFAAIALEPFRPDCPARRTSEFRIVRADGSVRWLHLVRMVIFRQTNAHDAVRVLGFVAAINGRTEHLRPWLHVDIAA
jgi:hypothetical protein